MGNFSNGIKEFHDNWRVALSRRISGRANREEIFTMLGEGRGLKTLRPFGDVRIFGAKVTTFGRQ